VVSAVKPSIWQLIAAFILSVGIGAGGAYAYRLIWPQAPEVAAKPSKVEHCVDRVTYLQFENAVVTKVRPDGKVWTCGGV
jgi:hypothetical protein